MNTAMWDRRYSKKGFAYGTEPNDFLRRAAQYISPEARVLSLGEGEGRNVVHLASLGLECTAVDSSKAGLAKARKLASDRGVRIRTLATDLANYDPGTRRGTTLSVISEGLSGVLRTETNSRPEAMLTGTPLCPSSATCLLS